MKILSFDKMATLEGGGRGYSSECRTGLKLFSFAKCHNIGFLAAIACAIISTYCPSNCACSDTV